MPATLPPEPIAVAAGAPAPVPSPPPWSGAARPGVAEEVVLGLDIGGTKIEAVVARRRGLTDLEVLVRRRIPTNAAAGYDAILRAVCDLVADVAREAGVEPAQVPIGAGMPGGVTRRGGLVKNSNTVCLNGRPFRSDLEARLGRRLAIDNDANCFTLAEARLGVAAPHVDGIVFGVILGTGVGGGVAVRGEIWAGAQGIAGEWGHTAVWPDRPDECYCGRRGCVELHLSGPAVERAYASRAGVRLPLAEIVSRRAADPIAAERVEDMLATFGRGLANVIDVLDPSAIVLGGGVSNVDLLYTEGVARVAANVFNDELTTPILRNALGDSAGVLGAALIASV